MHAEEEDDEDTSQFGTASQMTVHVMTPALRTTRSFGSPRSNLTLKLKAFFDDLINVTAPNSEKPDVRRPRIVYVRDFATLAPSSSIWWPALLAAVRQRRQGPISRPTSPVLNPTTVIFGITPSITSNQASGSYSSSPQGMINLMMARHPAAASSSLSGKAAKSTHGEDVASDKARERRMVHRLKRWARGDTSQQDLPQLFSPGEDGDDGSGRNGKPHFVMLGGPDGMSGLSHVIGNALAGLQARTRSGPTGPESRSRFFRTSIIIPSARSPADERSSRMARRREINELTMRMGIAAVGGELGKMDPLPETITGDSIDPSQLAENVNQVRMWEDWGRNVEAWINVRRIADRAVGSVIAANRAEPCAGLTLEPTPVPWLAIYNAWATDRTTQDLWKSLLLEPPGKLRDHDEDDEGKMRSEDEETVDEVVEKVKRDPELDQHEQRLLGCIVDTGWF